MRSFPKSWVVAAILALAVIGVGAVVFFVLSPKTHEPSPIEQKKAVSTHKVIGRSVGGRPIEAYTYGDGATHLLFVGGIHGGYEWNSVLLSYQFIDYLEEQPTVVFEDLTVSVIPSANPDGVFEVIGTEGRFAVADVPIEKGAVGTGRFNAHGVDLNRNFDCKWQTESMWRGNVVSAGSAAFSEPEARAIRDFVLEHNPAIVVFWHSQSNAVYASECEDGILTGTRAALDAYAGASGYPAIDSFDAYEITGDAEGWLASIGIPAITVELSTHETTEWERNLAGVKALFSLYSKPG